MNSTEIISYQLQHGAHLLPGHWSQAGLRVGTDPACSGPDQLTGSGPEGGTALLKSVKL